MFTSIYSSALYLPVLFLISHLEIPLERCRLIEMALVWFSMRNNDFSHAFEDDGDEKRMGWFVRIVY